MAQGGGWSSDRGRRPGVSGFRLLEVLKGDPATAAVPVLVVTALDFAAARATVGTGVDALLPKPFDAAALAAGAACLLAGTGPPYRECG